MARRSKKSTRYFASIYRWLPIQMLQNEIPQKNARNSVPFPWPMGDCNYHFKRNEYTTLSVYSVPICVAAVWNEGFFPKFLKEVGSTGEDPQH